MPTSIIADPIQRDIDLIVGEVLAPKAQRVAVANYALSELSIADAINLAIVGRAVAHRTFVNRNQSNNLEAVNPSGGEITFEFQLTSEVLSWIARTLADQSPVVSGDYRRGHILLADGAQADPDNAPTATVYKFMNTVPYARKIEVGITKSGRSFVIQVKPRIYERTFNDAKARFGNIVSLSYGFEDPSTYQLKQDQRARQITRKGVRYRASQRPDRVRGTATTVPVITVTLR